MDQYSGATCSWNIDSGTSNACPSGTGGFEAASLLQKGVGVCTAAQFCLVTDADGNFKINVDTPTSVYGSHTFTATDGTNTATAAFSTTPTISLVCTSGTSDGCDSGPYTFTSGFVGESQSIYFALAGFPASTKVTVSTPSFTTTSYTVTTDATGTASTTTGSGAANTVTVAKTAGGAYTITATTTTAVQTTTFTVSPSIAFYSSQTSGTVYSLNPTAYSPVYMEGYGFATGTIAAGSMTIGGTTVPNPSITVGTDGSFGLGMNNHTSIILSANVPAGPVTATLQGNTFSFANGNIICGSDDTALCTNWNTYYYYGAAIPFGAYVKYQTGAPLIMSPNSASAQLATDRSSYLPNLPSYTGSGTTASSGSSGLTGLVTLFAYGGATSATVTSTPSGVTCATSTLEQPVTGQAGSDAFYATCGATASTAIPETAGFNPSTNAAVTYPIISNAATATYGITPWVNTGSTEKGDYATALSTQPTPHGFESGETVSFYVAGTATVGTSSCTIASTGTCTAAVSGVIEPDVAGGSQAVTATGSLSGATATGTYKATVEPATYWSTYTSGGAAKQTALSITTGGAGSTTIMRTGTGSGGFGTSTGPYGVHGLVANTGYSIQWGIGPGATTLATFTSTATGGIPGGQIQFPVSSGTVGYHILSLVNTATGASALFDTHEFGGTFTSDAKGVSCFNGAGLTGCSSTSALDGQFGDLIFSLSASIGLSPSAGNVGSSVGVSASGLSATSSYYVWIQDTPGVYITNPTSTSTGGFATGTTFTMPSHATTLSSENATQLTVCVDSLTGFQGSTCSNSAYFILQAAASLSSSTVAPGGSTTLTATGLAGTATYNVVLKSSSGAKYTVAAFVTSALGAGTTSVPVASSMAAGTYTVELLNSASKYSLVAPPTLTVSSSAVTLGTSTLTATGSPAESVVNGQPVITGTFTNTAGTTLSVWMWVNILTSTGASSGYVYIGSATMASGQTVPIGATLLNLPHGTYTAQVFVTTTTGIAVSTTSTTAAFTV